MRALVHLFQIIRANVFFNVLGKVLPVLLFVVVLEEFHVVLDVSAVNVVAEGLGVDGLFLLVVARESRVRVGDKDTAVDGSFKGAKDTVSGGRATETDVEEGLERAGTVVEGFHLERLAVGFGLAFVLVGQTELGEHTTGSQETGAVGGSPVGQADLDAVLGELVGIGGGNDNVALELGVGDLDDDVRVGEADDEAVLGRVVLVLGLGDQATAGVEVGLALCECEATERSDGSGANRLVTDSTENGKKQQIPRRARHITERESTPSRTKVPSSFDNSFPSLPSFSTESRPDSPSVRSESHQHGLQIGAKDKCLFSLHHERSGEL